MAWMDPHMGTWGEDEAAHLARRAGFGATPSEITTMVANGMNQAVDNLVDFADIDQPLEDLIASLPDDGTLGDVKNPLGPRDLEAWWIYRMVHTTQPLQEQLTLFFHDHMVSEWSKVQSRVPNAVNDGNDGSDPGSQRCTTGTLPPDSNRKLTIATRLMRDQNSLLRTQGVGAFRDLLIAITRDPAMLFYLDNADNRVGKAQENYAREIMELFSMGVGNYSEEDVREVARAFTGETVNKNCADDWPFTHEFIAGNHDTDSKTVFGDTFNFPGDGEDTEHVIDLIMEEISGADISPAHSTLPATSIYMAWKFITWFVNETLPIDHPAVEELAQLFHDTISDGKTYSIREALRTLFRSELFYDPAHRHQMYKHPADFIVSMLRNLGLEETSWRTAASRSQLMGMRLFWPPNVAGWNHGKAWINSGNVINRFNYGNRLAFSSITTNDFCNGLITSGEIANETDHAGLIEFFRARLIQASLRAEETAALTTMLADIEASSGSTTNKYRRKVRAMVHVTLTLPMYQLK